MQSEHRDSSSSSNPRTTYAFPTYPPGQGDDRHEHAVVDDHLSDRGVSPSSGANGSISWQPRKSSFHGASTGVPFHSSRRGRQKSLSEALRTIQTRRGSVTDNAREIGEALKAPVSPSIIALCALWFMASIFSNASSKSILIAFRKPVTLTLIQFAFVSTWCVASSYAARIYPPLKTAIPALKHDILPPSRELIVTTLPLTAFQIGGHILNSDAMSRIPVSLVHTIKGLSPLFTVLAYRIFFRIHYTVPTYLSLVPLTLGVVMSCSANFTSDPVGLANAFGSAILFVTQNIVSKRLFNEAARAESEGMQHRMAAKKPDKLNLLCYSSALAFIFTLPIWLWSEAPTLFRDFVEDGALTLASRPDALDHGRLTLEFIFNGTFHFAQSLVAFVLLSMVSPVTYSVASLIKRVFVISFAVVWFGNPLTGVQGFGIGLTFLGLYLYDRTKDSSRAERRTKAQQARADGPLLPLIAEDKKGDLPNRLSSPMNLSAYPAPGPAVPTHQLSPHFLKPSEHPPLSRSSSSDSGKWLRPGTKQEETWKSSDVSPRPNEVSV